MKTVFKKCICMVLVICMAASMLIIVPQNVDAEVYYDTNAETAEFGISYDSSKYTMHYVSRKKIVCRNQYDSKWAELDKNSKLGTTTIKVCYLEPKEKTGDYYYAMAGCEVSMTPVKLSGDIFGMAQLAEFGIKTINEDSRVCLPRIGTPNVQDSMEGKIIFIQQTKNGEYASWRYDYKSKEGDIEWNKYFISPSKVVGQVEYRLDEKYTPQTKLLYMPAEVYYEIRFGAEDSSNGKVANRLGFSKNRDLSVMTGKIQLDY